MVYIGIDINNDKLLTTFLQPPSGIVDKIFVLCWICNHIYNKLGGYPGESYEFGSFFNSESLEKSKFVLIKDKLNNLRTSFIYLANSTALCIGVVIFQIMDDPPLQFFLIVLISQIIGTVMSLIFLCTVR